MRWLEEQTKLVRDASDPKAKVKALWSRDHKAIEEAARLLQGATEPERCMYCEHNDGGEIDHFWPKHRFPERAFAWENFLWACSRCNNRKGTDFPCDPPGRPVLLNPTDPADIPRDHLLLSPTTGRYEFLTLRGDHSIRVYDLNGDESNPPRQLPNHRRRAWTSVQIHIIMYDKFIAEGDQVAAADVRETIRTMPHSLVLVSLLTIADNPNVQHAVSERCREAILRHPEIRTWTAGW